MMQADVNLMQKDQYLKEGGYFLNNSLKKKNKVLIMIRIEKKIYDHIIIGGGILGLSIAYKISNI